MPFCTNCGKEVDPDDRECPQCSARIEVPEPEKRFCRQCGKRIDASTKFCQYCGASFAGAVTRPAAEKRKDGWKNPSAAVLMSMILPGSGSMYAGNVKDGTIILVLIVITFMLGLEFVLPWLVNVGLWIYGMIHAYRECNEYNAKLVQDPDERGF